MKAIKITKEAFKSLVLSKENDLFMSESMFGFIKRKPFKKISEIFHSFSKIENRNIPFYDNDEFYKFPNNTLLHCSGGVVTVYKVKPAEKKPHKQNFFNKIAGEFDEHVRQSIPLYDEFIKETRNNICRHHPHAKIVDICGSTGKFGIDLFDDGFHGEYINVDGSPKMIEIAEGLKKEKRQDGITNVLGGFLSSWEDESGVNIEQVDIRAFHADICTEFLGFQFFTKERHTEVSEMKETGKICIFCEKFSCDDKRAFAMNEDLKDGLHKVLFFSPEEITKKKENVLEDMNGYLWNQDDFKDLLEFKFSAVRRIYQAGNFAAYIASDDIEAVNKWEVSKDLINNKFNYDYYG